LDVAGLAAPGYGGPSFSQFRTMYPFGLATRHDKAEVCSATVSDGCRNLGIHLQPMSSVLYVGMHAPLRLALQTYYSSDRCDWLVGNSELYLVIIVRHALQGL